MRAWLLIALLGGCSNLLGIHALDDAGNGSDDGSTDGMAPSDGMSDGMTPNDAMTDSMTDGGATVVHIGEYNQLGSTSTVNGNSIVARRFTTGGTTVITGAGAYLAFETANGKVKFAIYNDNAGAPFTLRTSTTDITLDGTAGRNERTFATAHTVQAGTYWMVMATDSTLDIGTQDTNNVTGAAASLPYSGAFPSTYSPQPATSNVLDRINLYLQAQP